MLTDVDFINFMRVLRHIESTLEKIEEKIPVKSSEKAKIETVAT